MRIVLTSAILLLMLQGYGQIQFAGDTIKPGTVDTSHITVNINSKKTFSFCSTTFTLPQECGKSYPPDCCSYSTSLDDGEKVTRNGMVSCGNGDWAVWHYHPDLTSAKLNVENVIPQYEKQNKTFYKRSMTIYVFDKPCEGYLLAMENANGFQNFQIIAYGSHNGYHFELSYNSKKPITCNNDINPLFREIIRIN